MQSQMKLAWKLDATATRIYTLSLPQPNADELQLAIHATIAAGSGDPRTCSTCIPPALSITSTAGSLHSKAASSACPWLCPAQPSFHSSFCSGIMSSPDLCHLRSHTCPPSTSAGAHAPLQQRALRLPHSQKAPSLLTQKHVARYAADRIRSDQPGLFLWLTLAHLQARLCALPPARADYSAHDQNRPSQSGRGVGMLTFALLLQHRVD